MSALNKGKEMQHKGKDESLACLPMFRNMMTVTKLFVPQWVVKNQNSCISLYLYIFQH